MSKRHSMPEMKEGGVNVTPLIDVVMCLIIFFMLVAKIGVNKGGPKMDLPETIIGVKLEKLLGTLIINVTDPNIVAIDPTTGKAVRSPTKLDPIVTAIIDKDGRWCGIVDDVEFSGSAGKPMRIKALLVGPRAYEHRMPSWMFWFVERIAGDRMARVPPEEISEIRSVVKLKCRAEKLQLHQVEDRFAAWIPRWGAL